MPTRIAFFELQAALNVKIRPSSYTYFSIAIMLVKLFFRRFYDLNKKFFREFRPWYSPKTEQNLLTFSPMCATMKV